VPAFVIDLLLRRTLQENAWIRAVKVGVAFVVIFTTVQWAFGEFLMHGPSQNALFRTDNFPYLASPEWAGPQRRFVLDADGGLMQGLLLAVLFAILSARAGLAWGGWLRTVRR
jgi:hypothetical protein